AETMRISEKGINLVKAFEGCLERTSDGRFRPYVCPAGVLTIGWGHTNHHGRSFNKGSLWTQEECDAELESDMSEFEQAVTRLVTVQLRQHQFDALVSFAYNCGEANLAKSTLLRKVNARDFEGAAREFQKWNRGNGRVLSGLVRRRASEALMFEGVADEDFDGQPDKLVHREPEKAPMPQQVDPPTVEPMSKSTTGKTAETIGGLSALALLSQWLDALGRLPGKLLDALILAASKPHFWIMFAIVGGAAYIWFRRRWMKQEQGI